MAHGFRVYNAAGALRLDVSNRLTKVHSIYNLSTAASEVFQSVSGMADDGTWAVIISGYYTSARVASGGFYYLASLSAPTPGRVEQAIVIRV